MQKFLFAILLSGLIFSLLGAELEMQKEIRMIPLNKANNKPSDIDIKQKCCPVQYVEKQRGADVKALEKIKFPENPTRLNLIMYVEKIISASRDQNYWSPKDKQIEMLTKVGHANLGILINALKRTSNPMSRKFYLLYAIRKLAGPGNKAEVIKILNDCPELIDIIVKYHWEKDVKKILVDRLKNDNPYKSLPLEWISAVVRLNDPETYPVLERYYSVHGGLDTYLTIRTLPGIKIDEAVTEAWTMASKMPSSEKWGKFLTSIAAAAEGHKDALIYMLAHMSRFQAFEDVVEVVLKDSIDHPGSFAEKKKWLTDNMDNIVFDKKDKKYKLKSED